MIYLLNKYLRVVFCCLFLCNLYCYWRKITM
jgi:hypothetical protein